MINAFHFLWLTRGKMVLKSLELKYQFWMDFSLWRNVLSLSCKHCMALETTQSHNSLAGAGWKTHYNICISSGGATWNSLLAFFLFFNISNEIFQCPRMSNNSSSSHTLHKDLHGKVGWMAAFTVTVRLYENKPGIFHSLHSKVINISCNAV